MIITLTYSMSVIDEAGETHLAPDRCLAVYIHTREGNVGGIALEFHHYVSEE